MSVFTASPPNQTLPLRNVTDVTLNSTMAINTTVLTDHSYDPKHPVLMIVYPIILSVGLVGNTLSFGIMVQLSTSTFYLYLAVVAVVDSGYLVFEGLTSWMALSGIYNPFESLAHYSCSVPFACAVMCSQVSSWIIVAVTIDRYMAVCHPFKLAKYCTRRRAAICMGMIFLFLIGINIPLICFEWNDDHTQCLSPYNICLDYVLITDSICYVLLPGFLIALFNILIIRGLYKASRRRRGLAGGQETTTATIAHESARRTTIMLFSVTSVYFISLVLLVYVYVIVFVTQMTFEEGEESHLDLITASRMCVLLNHSVNFFLYGLSGKVFREKLADLCRIRSKANRSSARAGKYGLQVI